MYKADAGSILTLSNHRQLKYPCYVILGDSYLTLLLVGKDALQDQTLFQGLDAVLGGHSMMSLEGDVLGELCGRMGVPESHPVWLVVTDKDLTEAAVGQAPAVGRLLKRPRSARLSLDNLRMARHAAEEIGCIGEELVDFHLRERLATTEITNHEWVSDINAIAPYDFRIRRGGSWEKLEVNTTAGDFSLEFYPSLNEILERVQGRIRI